MSIVTYQAEVTGETAKAICCHLDGDNIDHWIARSQIQPASQVRRRGDHGTLIVTNWLVQQARLPHGGNVMAYELRPGQGSLFKNRDKGRTERSPNMKGTALLQLPDGNTVTLDIGAWLKESDNAGKWYSLGVKIKDQQTQRDNKNTGRDVDGAFPAQDPDIVF